jgi:arginine N-succinyltransferase
VTPAEGFVLRPAREDDVPAVVALAGAVTGGMTTLPADARHLEATVHESVSAFGRPVTRAGGERYLFVLEERPSGALAGVSAAVARVGGFDPFYTYEVRDEPVAHVVPGDRRVKVLHLRRDHKGPSELCSLVLSAAYRGRGLGRLLSLGRLLFMQAFPERFAPRVIAELRGWLDDDGRSPFWEAVGRHFFDSDFRQADFLSGLGEKDFIEDTMPRIPIYVPLLPAEVRDVIGRAHRDAEPARRMLEGEGFRFADEVDIFDAGPLLAADLPAVRAVREAREAVVGALADQPPPGGRRLVANGRLDFRAALGGMADLPGGRVALARATAELLEVRPGDTVTFVDAAPEG